MVSTRHTENAKKKDVLLVDWTKLSDELVIELFSRLNHLDRSSLSSTCKTWRNLGSSPSLWQSLDVRAYNFNVATALSLSSRCMDLSRLTFNEAQSSHPIISLGAHNLKELIGHQCDHITDSVFSIIGAEHPFLQTLQLSPNFSKNISSEAIRTIANSCPHLQKLKLSGIRDINALAINALASCCKNLIEIGFTDCQNIDEIALGNVLSLRFLSVAGTKNMNWFFVSKFWRKLPNLIGLDISRTNVDENCIYWLLTSSSGLRYLCALECPLVPASAAFHNITIGKKFLRDANDMYRWICSTANVEEIEEMKFRKWGFLMGGDKEMEPMMMWLECIFSHSFLWHYKRSSEVTSDFWCEPAGVVLFSFLKSKQDEVVEIGIETISNLVPDREGFPALHEGAISDLGDWYEVIDLLLCYCKSHKEGFQLQAIKGIVNLLQDAYIWKLIARQGGVVILTDLTKSMIRLVTEEATRGLYHLAFRDDCQDHVIDAGSVEALVQVLSKWSHNEAILVLAAAVLANLAYYERCAMEILRVGGVRPVLELAFGCPFAQVPEQALLALANLSRHGTKEHDYAGIGQRPGVIRSLVGLTQSYPDEIRLQAVAALSNLCLYEGHFMSCMAAGVIEAFVALARPGNDPELQEIVAAFLWKFSGVKENSIAIGERSGIAALIELTRSDIKDVRDNAVGALCNLSFLPCNASRIKDEGGVKALIEFCRITESKVAKFYSTLALACMYGKSNGLYRIVNFRIKDYLFGEKKLSLNHIRDFILTVCDPTIFSSVAASPTPSILENQAKELLIRDEELLDCRLFSVSAWVIERLISLLQDSCSDIKACAAFALVQLVALDNINWKNHTKYVEEAGGPKILHALAESKAGPNSVRVLSKIMLFCLEQNRHRT